MGVCEGPPKSILPDHLGHADYHGASINQSARFMDAGMNMQKVWGDQPVSALHGCRCEQAESVGGSRGSRSARFMDALVNRRKVWGGDQSVSALHGCKCEQAESVWEMSKWW